LLRYFNPGIEIYGLFGGEEKEFGKIREKLGDKFGHIYPITGKNSKWKWKNSDLALQLWYAEIGHRLAFDMLHVIEWDLIILKPLSELYSHIPEDGIGLSGLTLLKKIEATWPWTSKEPYKTEWRDLLLFVKEKYKYDSEPYACIAGGACFPRKYLEQYSTMNIPELCNDELRMPLFAQILGFKLYDTGLYTWYDKNEEQFFNVEIQDIKTASIMNEFEKISGRRVFHPYRMIFCRPFIECNNWHRLYNTYRTVKNNVRNILWRSGIRDVL
jgi:hypothetical protein